MQLAHVTASLAARGAEGKWDLVSPGESWPAYKSPSLLFDQDLVVNFATYRLIRGYIWYYNQSCEVRQLLLLQRLNTTTTVLQPLSVQQQQQLQQQLRQQQQQQQQQQQHLTYFLLVCWWQCCRISRLHAWLNSELKLTSFKLIWQHTNTPQQLNIPPHLTHVSTLPCKILRTQTDVFQTHLTTSTSVHARYTVIDGSQYLTKMFTTACPASWFGKWRYRPDDIGHNHIGHTKHHIGHKQCRYRPHVDIATPYRPQNVSHFRTLI